MPQVPLTESSPWMRALAYASDAAMAPTQQPEQPQPSNRIEDDRTSGSRGVTPQSPTTQPLPITPRTPPFLQPGLTSAPTQAAPATTPATGPIPSDVLSKRISQNQAELDRLNAPTKTTLMDRIKGGITGGLAGAIGPSAIEQQATLRDRIAERKQQERMGLSRAIDEDTRAQASEEMQTQRMRQQEEMQRNTQIAAAERLGQTIAGQNQRTQEQVQGRYDVAAGNRDSRESMQSDRLAQQAQEDAAKRQLALQIDKANNAVRLEVAQIRAASAGTTGAGGVKLAPQILKQAQTAQQILPQLDKLESQTFQMAQQLGPAIGRWNDFWTGKVGAPNPEFANYKAQMTFLESAVTLAHSQGRVSNLIFQQFQQLYDVGKQSPENMVQFIRATRDWMQQYASVLNQPQGGGATPARPNAPAANTPAQGAPKTAADYLKKKGIG